MRFFFVVGKQYFHMAWTVVALNINAGIGGLLFVPDQLCIVGGSVAFAKTTKVYRFQKIGLALGIVTAQHVEPG